MKQYIVLLLMVLGLMTQAQVPSYQRNEITTNVNAHLVIATNSVMLLSVPNNNGPEQDADATPPDFLGRFGVSWSGNKDPIYLWAATLSNSLPVWTGSLILMGGLAEVGGNSGIGLVNNGRQDPQIFQTIFNFDNNAKCWQNDGHASDDQGIVLQANNVFGSGASILFATMKTNASGIPVVVHRNHVALSYVSPNASVSHPGLIPGWLYTIIDSSTGYTTNHHGFAIAQDTFSDHTTTGNYSQMMASLETEKVYFPKMTLNAFNPWDAGFVASYFDNTTGNFSVYNALEVNGATTNKGAMTINGNLGIGTVADATIPVLLKAGSSQVAGANIFQLLDSGNRAAMLATTNTIGGTNITSTTGWGAFNSGQLNTYSAAQGSYNTYQSDGSTRAATLDSVLSFYNKEATAGLGTPYIVASVATTGANANIATQTAYTTTGSAGLYEVSGELLVTTLAAASTITVNLAWTDEVGAVNVNLLNAVAGTSTTRYAIAPQMISTASTTAIQYSTTLVNAPTYTLKLVFIKKQGG